MARLIDAEDVLRDKVWFCGGFVSDDFSMGYMEALDKVETVIRNAPTVDAVPVVHGRWLGKQLDNFRMYQVTCSECGWEGIENYDSYVDPSDFNYCPNCGAIMDLEVKDA